MTFISWQTVWPSIYYVDACNEVVKLGWITPKSAILNGQLWSLSQMTLHSEPPFSNSWYSVTTRSIDYLSNKNKCKDHWIFVLSIFYAMFSHYWLGLSYREWMEWNHWYTRYAFLLGRHQRISERICFYSVKIILGLSGSRFRLKYSKCFKKALG